jgi:mannose-6-phosphate isomerase-like protein (cupin superfamily)
MAYTPSPRPTFDGPAPIPYAAAARFLWGDAESGEVADWVYVSSKKVHQLMFALAPGGWFRHSVEYRTRFAADEVFYVLSGTMLLANPETGEVHRVETGEAGFFRRDTWHHAYNAGTEQLRVLELFAPPPSQGTSGAYARAKPNLTDITYAQDQHLTHWPEQREQALQANTMRVLRETDACWRLEGKDHPALVGLWVSTEHLTVGKVYLPPGQHTDVHSHGGDECLYVLGGTMQVNVPENNGERLFELKPGDGFYTPQGAPHRYYNLSSQPASLIFAVAPNYLPEA